jgi:hypothetical protein
MEANDLFKKGIVQDYFSCMYLIFKLFMGLNKGSRSSPFTWPSSGILAFDWKIKRLKNLENLNFKGGDPHENCEHSDIPNNSSKFDLLKNCVSFMLLFNLCSSHSYKFADKKTNNIISYEHISFWLLKLQFPLMKRTNSSGILRFRWRYPSWRGVYCVTGCPQKQTWFLEASYLPQLIYAFLDVERLSQLIIYLSHVVLLILFGH